MMLSMKRIPRALTGAAVLVMLLAGIGCQESAPPTVGRETARNVRILDIESGSIRGYFEISGPVAPVRGADLSAQESGPVVALTAAKGAHVVAGQVLVEQARHILRAESEAAAAARTTEAYNVDKMRQLHEAGKVSRFELLTAESSFARAKAAAEVATERYSRAAIRAPFDGVVADRYVELGQLVAPGMPVVRIIDPYSLKLEAYLTEEQVRWVQIGDSAGVALGDVSQAASGRVSWVGFEADRLTGKFKVEIELPNPDLVLRSGVIGRARLGKTVLNDVVAIPRDAVLPSRGGMTVFVVEGERAVLRDVTLGARQGLMVQVTAGLAVGDRLVVRGQRVLRDGNLVEITETAVRADGATEDDPQIVTGTEVGSRVPAAEAKPRPDGAVEANE